REGVKTKLFLDNTGFQIDDRVFFGLPNGLLHFKPKDIERNFVKPAPFLEKLVAEDEMTGEQLITHEPLKNNTYLSHKFSNISFSYSALSFTNPKSNRYEYALEGYNSNWKQTTSNRVVFNNLTPGRYTFKLKASNGDNIWSEEILESEFIIRPPVWRTAVAYVIYGFLVILTITLTYRLLRRQAIKHSEQEHERNNFLKEQELNRFKINFFTNLAHEIKTPVALIKTPLELILNKTDIDNRDRPDLQVMYQNTNRLTKLVEELLEFRKVESGKYELNLVETELNNPISNIYKRFIPFSESKGIQLSFSVPNDPVLVIADQEALVKVLSNLLTNAFKFARNKVFIELKQKENRVLISVEDDGPGIPKDKVNQIFEPYSQLNVKDNFKGVGIRLAFAKSLVELQKGELYIERTGNEG
ncbi:MAG: ATP-binding protein, partial [Desulfobacterales bacterium]|nr:ATP-binding protein [Desulfobacterales bacterium]